MRIVILGCGRVGSILASALSRAGHEVAIIDKKAEAFSRLEPGYTGERIIGLGIDEETLRRAGIDRAEAFVAVTNGDNTNVMAGQIALHKFRVPRVIARLYDPIRAETYRHFGLEIICSSILGAGAIHDLLLKQPQKRIEDYLEMGSAVQEVLPHLGGKVSFSPAPDKGRP